MNFLLSNRLFDRYLCRSMADQRSRQVIALTLKSPVMPCAALVIAKSERKIFLWIDFDSGARDCELTKVTESIGFDQLSNRLIDSVGWSNSRGVLRPQFGCVVKYTLLRIPCFRIPYFVYPCAVCP